MLLDMYTRRRGQQVVVPYKNNKESIINWSNVKRASWPYSPVTWQWINHLLTQLSKSAVYRFLSSVWSKLQIWMNQRGKWMFFKPPEQYQLLTWVQSLVTTRSINNFKEDWKDGIVLCALIESISPGACPRYDVLHPKQEHLNIELGLRLAESHLGLFSELTVPEILNMDDKTATKLQNFVAELHSVYQLISGMDPKPCCFPLSIRTYELEWDVGMRDQPTCFAKGMGLLMATKGRTASFNIYLQTFEFMDIVIEIKGRDNDGYCTERITLRSPRKKELTTNLFSAPSFIPLTSGRIINIPLEYVILSKKIAITYIPPSAGLYELSIISRGQHIFGSPFEVRVDNALDVTRNTVASVKPLLDSYLPHQDSDDSDGGTNKLPSIFMKKLDTSPHGLVKKRRLVKTTVLREYAMIELKPGEPLPQDPRAWSALTEPAILLDHRDEVQRDLLTKEICSESFRANAKDDIEIVSRECTGNYSTNTSESLEDQSKKHKAENAEQVDNVRFVYQNSPGAVIIESNERESLEIERKESKLNPQEAQHKTLQDNSEENINDKSSHPKTNLEEDIDIDNNEIEQHTDSKEVIQSMEQRPSYSFRCNDALRTYKNIFEQFAANDQNSKRSPNAFRQDPEGLESKGNGIYMETEKFHSNRHEDSERAITPIVQLRCSAFNAPNLKAGQGIIKGAALPRVPERLIDEWADLWNPNGESIVKARVKEWENIPKM